MALQSFEKRRPLNGFDGSPDFSDVRSGASTGMTEFAPGVRFSNGTRTAGDASAIEGLRARSGAQLRPLMDVRGDNGGPLSLADMEANTRAMDALDEHFSLRPSAKALELMQLEAETAKQSELAKDPLFRERAQAQMQFDQKDALDQLQQFRRQEVMTNYGDQLGKIQSHYAKAIEAARAAGDLAGQARLEQEQEDQESQLSAKFGFMGNDQKNILYR
jgi:hypothetical protein